MRNQQALIDLMKHFVEDLGVPGCGLSVSQHGEVLFKHFEGLADKENNVPFAADTVFRAYSCSKPITVAAAMILLERGKLLLTDPVEKYLPYFKDMKYYDYNGACSTHVVPCKNKMTVRDLMTMTNGLPYGGKNNLTEQDVMDLGAVTPNHPMALQEFCEQLAKVPLCLDPGTRWMYGYGCDVMGAVIEVASGKPLGQFMHDEIFAPLGMNTTGFFFSEAIKREKMAAIYIRQDDGNLVRDYEHDGKYEPEALFESGGGGLLSTLDDMTKFSQMMANGGELNGVKILSRKAIDLIRADHLTPAQRADYDKVSQTVWPNMLGYSFGLSCRTMVDRATGGILSSLGEFAWSGAAGTWALIDPETGISAEYAHQIMPSERNLQDYCHPRLRNTIYGALT